MDTSADRLAACGAQHICGDATHRSVCAAKGRGRFERQGALGHKGNGKYLLKQSIGSRNEKCAANQITGSVA
jgi:hypothetical protein